MNREELLNEDIIKTARKLADAHLIVGRAGNLSARLDKNSILISVSGSRLRDLKCSDIVKVILSSPDTISINKKRPSSELPLHIAIYKNFPVRVVIHCHPPLVNAYFAIYSKLHAFTFETEFYLKDVPVVEQSSLTVTKPELVIQALRKNKLVVIKNHGVFSIGENFDEVLERIEILEEAVRIAAVTRLFKKRMLDKLDKELKKGLIRKNSL